MVAVESGTTYPRCLAGKRSRPPEDVGGPPGYAAFLRVIADPSDAEHQQLIDWSGGDFDRERCDIVEINDGLTPINT